LVALLEVQWHQQKLDQAQQLLQPVRLQVSQLVPVLVEAPLAVLAKEYLPELTLTLPVRESPLSPSRPEVP
jgi:hypothetical protein